jgi:hypothetical protein
MNKNPLLHLTFDNQYFGRKVNTFPFEALKYKNQYQKISYAWLFQPARRVARNPQ